MELMNVIGRRRTIRFFQPFRPVEREKIQKMLEAARHASCAGNVMNVRAIVIWREQASDELIEAITPPIGYQQMQTAPCFLLWYNDPTVYYGANWIESVLALADARRIGTDVEATKAEINERLRPTFMAAGETMGVAPLAYMDVGQAIAQATLVAYDEGLGSCLMSGPSTERVAGLLDLPETAVPVCIQAVGYPAESWEAGGQTPKPPLGELFFEMRHGQPFDADPAVEAELREAKLIQQEAPLPWRGAELASLTRALELEERILNYPTTNE
ncbi:MAG: nitroreductase family protein [Dehalococcoidia bacterium]